jgi:hypothetical protein
MIVRIVLGYWILGNAPELLKIRSICRFEQVVFFERHKTFFRRKVK